jgi:hypothetical protein
MSNHRRYPRFALTDPWQGTLRTLLGVVVQPGDFEDQLVVISEKPGLTDEVLILDVLANGEAVRLTVRTLDSHPVVHEGAVWHRLRVAVFKGGSDPGGLAAMFNGNELFGVLGRQVPVRLFNISGGGCLLESRSRLDPGTTGGVRLGQRKREQYRDDVRVTRCQALEGAGSVYLVGAEFLWIRRPDKRSLRRVVRRLQRDLRAGPPT